MSTHLTSSVVNKIKLLEIEPVSDLGGVTQFIAQIIKYLPRDSFDIHFTASGTGDGFKLIESAGAIIHRVKIDYSLFTFYKRVRALRPFLLEEHFDIIHAHTVKAGLLAIWATKNTKTKVVFTSHGWRFLQLRNLFKRWMFIGIEKYIVQKASAVTYLTVAELAQGIKLVPSQKEQLVIPLSLGINEYQKKTEQSFREKYNIENDAFLVIMIGRKTYQKDPETFDSVKKNIIMRIPSAKFVWIGEGGDIGHVSHDEIIAALQQSNLLFFTSHFEGLPIALLEAMAAKLPIVAAAVSGIPEIIINEKTGLLFGAENVKEATEAIIKMYNNKTIRKEYSDEAFLLVQREYSPIDKCAQAFAAVYIKTYESNH